jgi:hypothetical protein
VFDSRPASAKPPNNELTHPEAKLSEISGFWGLAQNLEPSRRLRMRAETFGLTSVPNELIQFRISVLL